MQRKPNPRTLAVGFLAVSAALSVAVLAARNLYDDEISAFNLIISPVAAILKHVALYDVHPAGMYVLAHLAYAIVPSFRWINLFPLFFFYAGLSFFVLSVVTLFNRIRSQLCFLLLATLHPQLLMWNNTFRWYSWWTGLALIALAVALQPRTPHPRLTAARALGIALLLAGLFYLNYITLLFAPALAAAMFVRYRTQPRRQLATLALLAALVFAALIGPQLHTMVAVHLPNSDIQRSSILVSLARLLLSLAASEAFLPWHPLAIGAVIVFASLFLAGVAASAQSNPPMATSPPLADQTAHLERNERLPPLAGDNLRRPFGTDTTAPFFSMLLFGLIYLALVAASGLGGKPRNGLLLIPVLAPAAAIAIGTLRPRLQTAVLLFFALWTAAGAGHLLGRYGMTKATMNDRPEQVVAFIQHTIGSDCPLVITHDTELSFALSQSRMPNLILDSGTPQPHRLDATPRPAAECADTRLYVVRSYLGERSAWADTLDRELNSATNFIEGPPRTDSFSPDPDAPMKRRFSHLSGANGQFAPAAQLPDFRYMVTSGSIDPHALPAILKALPDFTADSSQPPAEDR
jgi:hypothetical protein